MINTYAELHLPPAETLKRMVAESLKVPADINVLTIGEPIVVSGVQTKVAVGVDRTIAPVDYWQYIDDQDFIYDRIDIQELFGDYLPVFRIPQYVSTAVLFQRLQKETGVVFTTRDYMPIVVEPQSGIAELPINPASYRFVGQLKVRLLRK